MEVRLNGHLVSRPPFRTMYWTPAQMLAHTTVNGAPTRTGDIYASGTVSGPERDQRGSLLELSWGGSEPIPWPTATAAPSSRTATRSRSVPPRPARAAPGSVSARSPAPSGPPAPEPVGARQRSAASGTASIASEVIQSRRVAVAITSSAL